MFKLEKRFADEMVAHALSEDPNECCGLLAGQEGEVVKVYSATNAVHSPYRYVIDPKELLRFFNEIEWGEHQWKVIGNYHSHTHSEAYPSPTDVREAHLGPEAIYLLISLRNLERPDIRAFHIDQAKGSITEEPLEIVE